MKDHDWNCLVLFAAGTICGCSVAIGIAAAIQSAHAGAATGNGPSISQFLYDWQTLIGAFLALSAAIAAWIIGRRQIIEQRTSSLLSFLIEDKLRCDENLPSVNELRRWLSSYLTLTELLTNDPPHKRLWFIQSVCRAEPTIGGIPRPTAEESYDDVWRKQLLSNAPKCKYPAWQIRLDGLLNDIFDAGTEWKIDEKGNIRPNTEVNVEQIQQSFVALNEFHAKVSAETDRMMNVIDIYNKGRNRLIKEVDDLL